MDRMTLLARARSAGLEVVAEGGQIRITGPKRAEAVALELLEHKRELLTILAAADAPGYTTEESQMLADVPEKLRATVDLIKVAFADECEVTITDVRPNPTCPRGEA